MEKVKLRGRMMKDVATWMMTLLAAGEGTVMLAVEMNRTHATNPAWTGHARFHLVWQNITTALFAVLELVLLWWPGPDRSERFYLAAVVAAIPLIGFVAARLFRTFYGGKLADDNGVPPLRLHWGGRPREFDGNSLAVWVAWVILVGAVALFR